LTDRTIDTGFSGNANKLILLFLTIQIASVSISIAVSSIAFGIWGGIWIIQMISQRKIGYDKELFREMRLINIFTILYFIFEINSRIFAVYPEGAFANIKRLLLFLIFYVSVIKIINIKTLSEILFVNISAISVISTVELFKYAMKFSELIRQMPFSEIRIDYFNYPLTTAEIKMISFLSVFPVLFIKEKFFIDKKYLIVVLIPVFISMILTQSRNVFLGLFISFLVFGVFFNRKFLLAFIGLLIISYFILPSGMTDRISSIADINHPSNASRLTMWNVGYKMFKDHPLTGIADSHIKEIYETYKKSETESEGVHLHSNYLMILATTGIFGFLSFAGIYFTIFIKQIKYYKEEKIQYEKMLIAGSILVMISFHVAGIFEWSFGDHEVMTVFFFLTAVPFVIRKNDKQLSK
jgi:O-antigen ligase